MPSREKYWSELTADEKVERIRQMVKQTMQEVKFLHEQVERLLSHEHTSKGMVIPLDQPYGRMMTPRPFNNPLPENPDETYF